MILELMKLDGRIEAVCNYITVTEEGRPDKDGAVLIVLHMEKSEGARDPVKYFMKKILNKHPLAKKLMFVREYKYKGRTPRMYNRYQIERLIRGI